MTTVMKPRPETPRPIPFRFVYVRGTGGAIVAEKWPLDAPKGVLPLPEEKGGQVVLHEVALGAEHWNTPINDLMIKYPRPTCV